MTNFAPISFLIALNPLSKHWKPMLTLRDTRKVHKSLYNGMSAAFCPRLSFSGWRLSTKKKSCCRSHLRISGSGNYSGRYRSVKRVTSNKKSFSKGFSESGRDRGTRWFCKDSNITARHYPRRRDTQTSTLLYHLTNRVSIRGTSSNPQFVQAIRAEALWIRLWHLGTPNKCRISTIRLSRFRM